MAPESRLDNVIDVLQKPVDVGAEVFFQQSMVFFVDATKSPVGRVLKGTLSRIEFQILDLLCNLVVGQLRVFVPDLGGFRRSPVNQNAFQAANDNNRQNAL